MIRKNKKFIDPRYFMDEKMETALNEALEITPEDFATKVHQALYDETAEEQPVFHQTDAYGVVAKALGVETQEIARLFNNYLGDVKRYPAFADRYGVRLIQGDQLQAIG